MDSRLEGNEPILKDLCSLAQLDIDAVFAYSAAIEKVDVEAVKVTLERFKKHHERHISELSLIIARLGGTPPSLSLDFKGYLIEGLTRIRSTSGTSGALKAIHGNELLTNSIYEKALSWDLPIDILELIRKNKKDEEIHLGFIDAAVENQVWKSDNLGAQAAY